MESQVTNGLEIPKVPSKKKREIFNPSFLGGSNRWFLGPPKNHFPTPTASAAVTLAPPIQYEEHSAWRSLFLDHGGRDTKCLG